MQAISPGFVTWINLIEHAMELKRRGRDPEIVAEAAIAIVKAPSKEYT